MFFTAAILGILALTARASTSWGTCSNLRLVDNFKLDRYVGHWFEQARDKNFRYEKGDC